MPPLPPERLLLPFVAGPYRMAMNLVALPPDELLEIDEHYPAEMAERRGLLATRHADVFAVTPGSEAAREEVLSVIAALLPRRYPGWFTRDSAVLHNHLTGEAWDLTASAHDPLELAGRLVQEDLCLIDTAGPDPVLCAAILCAPTRWRLREKIGQPLAAVHGPVPIYAERLARPVDRFMNALQPGRLTERVNWSVIDDGALFQLHGKHRTTVNSAVTPENAPQTLFLRVERQTLMRLPRSGSVLFAIHVHSYPLARVLAVPGAAAALAAAVRGLPGEFSAYKSIPTIEAALLACLESYQGSALDPAGDSRHLHPFTPGPS